MQNNSSPAVRIIIIILAVISLVLAGVFAMQKMSSAEEAAPEDSLESVLEEYNSDEVVSTADGEQIYIDSSDDTIEMDSIPADAETAGAPEASSSDAE